MGEQVQDLLREGSAAAQGTHRSSAMGSRAGSDTEGVPTAPSEALEEDDDPFLSEVTQAPF